MLVVYVRRIYAFPYPTPKLTTVSILPWFNFIPFSEIIKSPSLLFPPINNPIALINHSFTDSVSEISTIQHLKGIDDAFKFHMVELDLQIPTAFDPFAEAKDSGAKEYVHIRIQQRNGKKSLTTVQGLKKEFSYEKILKDLKKELCCNGTVVQDKELGKVIQLQGDQRKNVSHFLTSAGIVKKDLIKIHGF